MTLIFVIESIELKQCLGTNFDDCISIVFEIIPYSDVKVQPSQIDIEAQEEHVK